MCVARTFAEPLNQIGDSQQGERGKSHRVEPAVPSLEVVLRALILAAESETRCGPLIVLLIDQSDDSSIGLD